ncbi:unnamed protein product, partial [Mesorhabditis belari]|uniref:Uncharacterized protein n=1 Tax=Mesorhabditis belari TaxID=2138241 RepID=A0AAF3FJ04_9BILA
MVDLKQQLNTLDYFGVVAVWVAFFSVVAIISMTCILWCCVTKDDDVTVFQKWGMGPRRGTSAGQRNDYHMTYSRSFSPNGLQRPNPDYLMCGGTFHATTAAKIFAVYQFLACLVFSAFNFWAFGSDKLSLFLFCIAFTMYSVIVIYGVFLEKKSFLLPFLFVHFGVALVFLLVTCTYAGLGAFTDFIANQHRESAPLRDLYGMHKLNPDSEGIQTITSSAVLFLLIISTIVQMFSWLVMLRTYQCYRDADRTIVPKDGYNRGFNFEVSKFAWKIPIYEPTPPLCTLFVSIQDPNDPVGYVILIYFHHSTCSQRLAKSHDCSLFFEIRSSRKGGDDKTHFQHNKPSKIPTNKESRHQANTKK